MQLFKSQCLQEQSPVATRSYRDPGFGLRYARRAVAGFDPPAFNPCVSDNDDDGDFAFNAEREMLRLMADYDHAA